MSYIVCTTHGAGIVCVWHHDVIVYQVQYGVLYYLYIYVM